MLTLLVPILINYLLEGQALRSANKYSLTLHDTSLQWLMKIGPKYPQEFKKLMSQASNLKTRLENAIRANQQTHRRSKLESNTNKQISNQIPSIKLKTDFSNFS